MKTDMIQRKWIVFLLGVLVWIHYGHADACKSAYNAFVNSDFDNAIKLCEAPASCGYFCRLITAFSFVEKAELINIKEHKKKAKDLLKALAADTDLRKMDEIVKFSWLKDKNATIKQVERLSRVAFKQAETYEDINYLIPFLREDYHQVIYLPALKALKRFLKANREYVNEKGGTLPLNHQNIFENERLLKSLVALAKNAKSAVASLEFIEEPALRYLERVNVQEEWAAALMEKIEKAILKREAKHPDSTWYSANPRGQ